MTKQATALALSAILALAGCEGMTREERMVVGGLTGAAAGVVTAEILDVDDNWVIVAALAGAAIGSIVARNAETGDCAYAIGGGRYRIAPCP